MHVTASMQWQSHTPLSWGEWWGDVSSGAAAVVVLSHDFVRKRHPMEEVRQIVQQREARQQPATVHRAARHHLRGVQPTRAARVRC